ncbi:TetR/AcrR family transcriptional regulator [Streptomyces sp. bgisy100]|uniref:TetR/AcrR family transcriptional regulator n=1 Tax=Streptomyces sp. bgisy100 TaxID=3413783 RepID=UPI003D75E47D
MIVRPTDESMLAAASAVFADIGFHTATMEDIATRAGTTKPTLYSHFGSKDDLYRHCGERAAETLGRRLSQAYASAEPTLEQQVRAGTLTLFGYATEHAADFRLLFGADPVGTITVSRKRLMDTAAQEIAGRIRDFTDRHGSRRWGPSAELCATLIVGLTVEGARYALLTDSLDVASGAEFASAFTVAALRNIDSGPAEKIDDQQPGPESS